MRAPQQSGPLRATRRPAGPRPERSPASQPWAPRGRRPAPGAPPRAGGAGLRAGRAGRASGSGRRSPRRSQAGARRRPATRAALGGAAAARPRWPVLPAAVALSSAPRSTRPLTVGGSLGAPQERRRACGGACAPGGSGSGHRAGRRSLPPSTCQPSSVPAAPAKTRQSETIRVSRSKFNGLQPMLKK